MKDELDEKIMTEFVGLRAKTYSYLTDNNDKDKISKGKKNVSLKEHLNLKIINYLEATQLEN